MARIGETKHSKQENPHRVTDQKSADRAEDSLAWAKDETWSLISIATLLAECYIAKVIEL
jgi:hypothetical protein